MSARDAAGSTARPITRDDIEAKMRAVQGGTQAGADAARGAGRMMGFAGAGAGVLLAYFLGRRRGKKRRTFIEIKRV
jgi:hypothetical protein